MGLPAVAYALPYSAVALVCAGLLAVVLRRRRTEDRWPLGAFLTGLLGWTTASFVAIAGEVPMLIALGSLFGVAFTGLVVVGWFTLGAASADSTWGLSWPVLVAVVVVPAGTILLAVTQALGLHSLLFGTTEVEAMTVSGGTELVVSAGDPGPWFLVHSVHSWLFLIAGTVLLVRSAVETWGPSWQAGAVVLGVLAPVGAAGLLLTGVTPLDYTSVGFGIAAVAVTVGSSRTPATRSSSLFPE